MSTLKIFCFTLFAVIHGVLWTQSNDSTQRVIFHNPQESIETRIEAGIKLTESWLRKDNSKALEIAEEVKNLATEQGNSVYIIKSLLNYGKALEWTQEYKNAKAQYQLANTAAIMLGADSLLVDALCGLAHAHYMLHEVDSAAAKYIEAVKLVDESTNFAQKADVYVQFAEYNRSNTRYDLAIQYLDKARALVQKNQVLIETEIEMYSRYAAVWNETDTKADSAMYYSELCIELGEKINDLHVVATSHNELASIQEKLHNPEYLQHLLKAIEIWKGMNYLAYEGRAILNLILYTKNSPDNDHRRNIELVEDFLVRAKDKDLPILKQDLYHVLSGEYELTGNTRKALEVLKIYSELLSRNTLMRQQMALNEAQEKFEAEKHLRIISEQENNLKLATEEKLREQEMRKAKEAESRNYLILSMALLVVLAAVIYLIFKSKRQNQYLKLQEEKTNMVNAQLEAALQEKELLLKEIHHRVKNNLQIVVGLLELQSNRIEAEPVKKALLESINRVRSMSLVHQKLYMGDNLGKVDVKDYIASLIREIEFSNNKGVHKLEKELVLPELIFDIDSIIPIGLIITELLTNSFKYAFNQDKSFVRIEIKPLADGRYLLTYQDNGPGLPPDFEISRSRSLGMRLVQQLSRQLNGEVTYTYENGAKFLIRFEDSGARKKTA